MHQQALALDAHTPHAADRCGFELGWDHARHGVVPPAELLLEGTPIGQGWRAGKTVMGARSACPSRPVRQWLALRTRAWREGIAFEPRQLTAQLLSQLETTHCPLLRCRLGGTADDASAPAYERLNTGAGYAAGNLVQVSRGAASAWQGLNVDEIVRRARRAQVCGEAVEDLEAAVWWRMAAMRSFATPLPFAEAARVPLAVLPPNRVRVLNAVQRLQVLVTAHSLCEGWSTRLRAIAQMLSEEAHRHDFNLVVGALAPHALQPAHPLRHPRHRWEDAWLSERLQRRWQTFALALGESDCQALLTRALDVPVPGHPMLELDGTSAPQGWALDRGGRMGAATTHHAVRDREPSAPSVLRRPLRPAALRGLAAPRPQAL